MKLDFHIGAPVHCKDRHCGKLIKVVVNPDTQVTSDLIVQQGLLPKHARVLPVASVARATPTEIVLNLYSDELDKYAEYRETAVKEPARGGQVIARPARMPFATGLVAHETVMPMVHRRLREGVAAGTEVLARKTRVENVNRVLGYVDHVVVDTQSGKITQIVMRKGMLPTYHVIPMGEVEEIHEEYVLVSLFRADLDHLPRYEPRPDAEMLEILYQALLAESTPAFHGIKPVVDGGSVRLTGSVPSAAAKLHAEELAYLIPGVIDVQNDLLLENVSGKKGEPRVIQNNENVVVRLSQALAADAARTKDAVIEVIEARGIVTLQGAVADAKTRADAEEIARQVAGITVVVNELAIASRV